MIHRMVEVYNCTNSRGKDEQWKEGKKNNRCRSKMWMMVFMMEGGRMIELMTRTNEQIQISLSKMEYENAIPK